MIFRMFSMKRGSLETWRRSSSAASPAVVTSLCKVLSEVVLGIIHLCAILRIVRKLLKNLQAKQLELFAHISWATEASAGDVLLFCAEQRGDGRQDAGKAVHLEVRRELQQYERGMPSYVFVGVSLGAELVDCHLNCARGCSNFFPCHPLILLITSEHMFQNTKSYQLVFYRVSMHQLFCKGNQVHADCPGNITIHTFQKAFLHIAIQQKYSPISYFITPADLHYLCPWVCKDINQEIDDALHERQHVEDIQGQPDVPMVIIVPIDWIDVVLPFQAQ